MNECHSDSFAAHTNQQTSPIVHHRVANSTTASASEPAANMLQHQRPTNEPSSTPTRRHQTRMTASVNKPILVWALVGLCWLSLAQAAHMVIDPTSTTPAGSSLEDPSSSEVSATTKDESMCDRCYESVEKSQELIDKYQKYVESEKKLLRLKQIAAHVSKIDKAAASTTTSTTTTTTTSTRRPRLTHMGQPASNRDRHRQGQQGHSGSNNAAASSTGAAGLGVAVGGSVDSSSAPFGHPTVRNVEGTPIIVSRLRVARSSIDSRFAYSNSSRPKPSKRSREGMDMQIAQLKLAQKQVLNETCKAIHALQQCVEDYNHECLGNLQYHSFESFASQWMAKLNCPSYRYPNIRPWPALIKKFADYTERIPVPRPLTSNEEVQKRLDQLFGGLRPPGVMLKPTMNQPAIEKFNSIDTSGQQRLANSADTKSLGAYNKGGYQPSVVQRGVVQSGNLAGHLLLVPCCFMIIVLALVLARLHSPFLKQQP